MSHRLVLHGLEDIPATAVLENQYDCAFFAGSYESRSTNLAKSMDFSRIESGAVFAFAGSESNSAAKKNIKALCKKDWPVLHLEHRSDRDVVGELTRVEGSDGRVKILVDYSSMTRVWYSAILNWARYQTTFHDVIIDFVYSIGSYSRQSRPMEIEDIVPVRGFEGSNLTREKSAVVVGLGFEAGATLCVLDRLEPTSVYPVIASPGATRAAERVSYEENDEILGTYQGLRLPLRSVESTFKSLSELLRSFDSDTRITLVPMGPKPQVLAAFLICMQWPEATCLRISGRSNKKEPVRATGEMVCTRVHFSNARQASTIVDREMLGEHK